MSIEWLKEIKAEIPRFLARLKYKDTPGLYRYSLSGDCLDNSIRWGLGNAVFAAKIYYMLDALEPLEVKSLAEFIKSFQDKKGYIHDPQIQRLSRPRRFLKAIRQRDFIAFFHEQTKRAETRQSFAALRCLHSRPNIPYLHIPYTKAGIEKYIYSLNWREPWGAGSHVSHLLFFLNNNRIFFNVHQDNTDDLIDYAIRVTDRYQQKDGSWYTPECQVTTMQKVNAAMKMMTAYEAAERNDFSCPDKLIDLCLSAANDGDACNHFNIICVLYHCSRRIDYKIDEIKEFCLNRLEMYKKHYWPEYGGFSFLEGKANSFYYRARITKGLPEPDIHGTVLFLWGITLITRILKLENNIKLRIPTT